MGRDLADGRANLMGTRSRIISSELSNALAVTPCAFMGPGEPMLACMLSLNARTPMCLTIGYRLRVGRQCLTRCYHRLFACFAADTSQRIFMPAILRKEKSIATESGPLPCYRHLNMAAPGTSRSHSISRF